MSKSLALYALGIVTGILVTVLWLRSSDPTLDATAFVGNSTDNYGDVLTESLSSEAVSRGQAQGQAQTQIEPDDGFDALTQVAAMDVGVLTRMELAEIAEAARVSMMAARQELNRRDRLERLANQPAPELPIVLPPEFDWLMDEPSALHELTQREPLDPNWSPVAEAQLHRFFQEQPEIVESYGSPTINCRTNYCEVALVAYGLPDASSERAPAGFAAEQSFREAFADVYDQPWAEQFGLGATSGPFGSGVEQNIPIAVDAHVEGGTTTFLWHLYRMDRLARDAEPQ